MVSEHPSIAFGRRIKRQNALTAAAFGGLLAAVAGIVFPPRGAASAWGFVIGLVYANLFEYALHRFILHAREGLLAQTHGVHHRTWRAPDESLYVNFARSPWIVMLLFGGNALPVLAAEWLMRLGFAAAMIVAFVPYFIVVEEVHWRIHMGGLPGWLEFARRHHLRHHARGDAGFNVYLPLFDRLLGTA
ncbi:MAG: sterol desaturase family protein [Terriglobia bacterium]